MADIKHVWFDLEGTIVPRTEEFNRVHDALVHETYAKSVGKPLSQAVIEEYEARAIKNTPVIPPCFAHSDFHPIIGNDISTRWIKASFTVRTRAYLERWID